jgi:hypothetical protein
MKSATLNWIFVLFLIIAFSVGMMVYARTVISTKESMQERSNTLEPGYSGSNDSCPDMLVKNGEELQLINSKFPDAQPLTFKSLDEYQDYMKRSGSNCPVLFIQKENNTQGEDVYRVRPGPFNQEGGLPVIPATVSGFPAVSDDEIIQRTKAITVADASRAGNFNQGQYPGFDPQGLYVGRVTDVDKVHVSTHFGANVSDNPMDPNWGGVEFTRQAVNAGKYKENEVTAPALVQPKNGMMPGLVPPGMEPPRDKY